MVEYSLGFVVAIYKLLLNVNSVYWVFWYLTYICVYIIDVNCKLNYNMVYDYVFCCQYVKMFWWDVLFSYYYTYVFVIIIIAIILVCKYAKFIW